MTPISDINSEVPKAISDVINRGMAVSQEQRYKTAREMQKALRDAYARLQTDMSANTVAFDAASPQALPQSPQKTAELSGVPLARQTPAQSHAAPTAYDSSATTGAETNVSQPPTSGKSEPNFDATMRYDSTVPEPSSKQSDIRTEVFLAGSLSAIASVQKENHARNEGFPKADNYGNGDNMAQGESFAAEDDFGAAENYSPGITVPLITFDNNDEAGAAKIADGFDSIPERDGIASAGATYIPTENSAPSGAAYSPLPAALRKSSGKGLAIAGGLFALLFLAISAAGIGWYLLRDKGATTDSVTPTPTAEATVSLEPTITTAPTVEVVTETESSTTNTSTNSEVTSSDSNSDSGDANSTITTRPTQTTVQTTVQPPPVRAATPRSTPQVMPLKTPTGTGKTPTPAKTPKRTAPEQ